jgi:hypothetical protein
MKYGEPEITAAAPCPACGCRELFRDLARPGERERPVILRCCRCRHERDDLEFYEAAA